MKCTLLKNENTSLHGNVIQFFLLQLGLPFFRYGFPSEYILERDSLVPKETNIKKLSHVLRYILTYHTSHTEAIEQFGIF